MAWERVLVAVALALSLCTAVGAAGFGASPFSSCPSPPAPDLPIAVLSGPIDDCCCAIETVDANNPGLNRLLNGLAHRTFFNFFMVDYQRECPFWMQNHLCFLSNCAVCECDENEIPAPWRAPDVDASSIDPDLNAVVFRPPDSKDEEWAVQDYNKAVYINLLKNPETFTGYSGHAANRVWTAIYRDNCLAALGSAGGLCLEDRLLYRLISGLHASITAHIAQHYFHNDRWAPNLDLFKQRLGSREDWMKNLYFAFMFLSRAVQKARPVLEAARYDTGHAGHDAETLRLVRELLDSPLACGPFFDERELFAGTKASLKKQFRERFRNISVITDCIDCEKCRIHGKLQILGIGTALRIVLADDEDARRPLHRNEIIALVQTLTKFSNSIDIIHKMRVLDGGALDGGALDGGAQPASPTSAQSGDATSSATTAAAQQAPSPPNARHAASSQQPLSHAGHASSSLASAAASLVVGLLVVLVVWVLLRRGHQQLA